jgi:hypothetical protein
MPTMKYTKSELDIKLREKLPPELNETFLASSLASGVLLSGFETKLSALPLSWVNDVPAELREAGNVLILLFVLY